MYRLKERTGSRTRVTRVTRGVGLQPENLADRLLVKHSHPASKIETSSRTVGLTGLQSWYWYSPAHLKQTPKEGGAKEPMLKSHVESLWLTRFTRIRPLAYTLEILGTTIYRPVTPGHTVLGTNDNEHFQQWLQGVGLHPENLADRLL
eukprot:1161816-Pelagomonas_calceolata.AAC.8